MDFSQALLELKAGRRVRRDVWTLEGWFSPSFLRKRTLVPYVQGTKVGSCIRLFAINHGDDGEVKMDWMPEYHDLFAIDWQLVSDDEK